ncbi:MAG: sugar phosphate isomerase/epimerase [Armatimonadetes bacterium]|nr:sugar phosphate isomerase/epimerase [Armatimonadota bacterium]
MKSQLAVQMYTVRDHTKTAADLAQTLEKIRDIGYPAVQLSAVGAMGGENPEVSPEQARRMLDDNGLQCIATHRSWDELAGKTQQEIDFHRTLGCDFTAIGSLPSSYQKDGAEGYRRFVHDAGPVIERLKAAGIRFGYHNHAFEFERVENGEGDARTLFDILIEEGGPDFNLELDLYWIAHAGVNPERIVERCRGRVPVIHVKDKEVAGKDSVMAPAGEGNLDWEHLLPACDAAGVEWYAVEQDTCRRDPFDCLRSSFEFLSRTAADRPGE